MATAAAYDEWEDVGVSFSEEDLRNYRPGDWASERVARLLKVGVVLLRREDLPDMPKPGWTKKARQAVLQRMITWYCQALDVPCPEISPDELRVDPKSSEGKAITKAALELKPADIIGLLRGEAEAGMRHVVTIGRRCASQKSVSGWKKADGSYSNKLANAIQVEIRQWNKLETELESSAPDSANQG